MPKTKQTKKNASSAPYDEWLIEKLKNNELAIAYLNNALQESRKGDTESLELLFVALRNVIQAHGGMAKIAKKAKLGRESLYKTVSLNGNPEFRTIAAVTHALGMELKFA